jgi:hypothetical protein
LVVGLLVGASAIYALWTLCPKAARSRLAASLLKLPHPRFLEKPLLQAVKQQGGCGCDGCDRSAAKAGETVKPVTLYRPSELGRK